jgi:hypothetical protein
MVAAFTLSLALASFTHHFIEVPCRMRQWKLGRTVMVLWVVPFVTLLVLFFIAQRTAGFAILYPKPYRDDYLNAGLSVFDQPRAEKCWGKVEVTRPEDCTLGAKDSPVKAVLWGDSHAYHQIDFIDEIGKKKNLAIQDMAFTMCAPIARSPEQAGDPGFQRHAEQCQAHDAAVIKYILAHPEIKIVFMSAVWDLYADYAGQTGPRLHGYRDGEFRAELLATIAQLNQAGKRVVLLDDTPILPEELENCGSNHVYLPKFAHRDCSFSRPDAAHRHAVAEAVLNDVVEASPSSAIISTYYAICNDLRCFSVVDDVPLYKHNDRGHLGAGGSRLFFSLYQKKFPQQLDEIFQ